MIKIPIKQKAGGEDDGLKIKDNHDIISNPKIINSFPQLLLIKAADMNKITSIHKFCGIISIVWSSNNQVIVSIAI